MSLRVFQGNFLDPETLETRTGYLMVEGGRIREIAASSPLGTGVEKLEGTVIPGLIDAHIHLCLTGSGDPVGDLQRQTYTQTAAMATQYLRNYLAVGVTAVRDMGSPGGLAIDLGRLVDQGGIPGPEVVACGANITITGGHGYAFGLEADGPDGVRRAARLQLKAGARQLKFMATGGVLTQGVQAGAEAFTEEELRAGIEEAHKVGKLTGTHAQGLQGIKNALRAGIDTVEHGPFDAWDAEALDLVKRRGVVLVPTLAAVDGIMSRRDQLPAWMIEKTAPIAELHRANTLQAYREGVVLGVGTDAGTPFNPHPNLARELELLAQIGVSLPDLYQAATLGSARALGQAGQMGSMAPGAWANLVVLGGNPLEDVAAYRKIQRVIFRGQA